VSSAILYVAIVAIWAGVLIPRWLRRDSAGSGRDSEGVAAAEPQPEASAEAEVTEGPAPAPAPRRRDDIARREAPRVRPAADRLEPRPEPRPKVRVEAQAEVPRGGPRDLEPRDLEPRDGESRDLEHKKVLSSRRRLLGMLLVLAIASGVLAYTRMAAWWVVVPPAIMLLGYLGLLRAASKADAEWRELARTRAAVVAAAEVAAEVAAAKRAAPPAPAAPAPAPDAEVIDISASLTVAGHKFYDQYADAKLRAVGD
jgi:hypothetical protein